MTDATAHALADAVRDCYRLERELGRGGMATVWLARDLKHDRPVALKVLRPELAATVGPERFLREIKLTARLQHPHILPLFDSGQAAGLLWYVMPYVEGESLRQRLATKRRVSVEEAVRLTLSLLSALAYAHEQGIIHRDIKPENILLERGEALLADFGIAQAVSAAGGERLTATGLALGTPTYMSPEQATGQREIDQRSDLYSLGCVLYEMLAGQPPFTGPNAQAVVAQRLSTPAPRLRSHRQDTSKEIEHAVATALARDPAERFASATEFAEALVHPVRWHARARRPRARSLMLGMLAIVTVAAALALTLRSWRRPARPLDPNLVAVAPLRVLTPQLELWREGFVDILSRNLDGAGPLRTVSPALVLRHWRGFGDPSATEELGRRTGARLVVSGSLLTAGPDSVRLVATVLDAETGRSMGEIDLKGPQARIDRLTDSATVGLIRELGRRQPIGAVRHAAFASVDLPVLRSFLRGEQFFRRTAWDSAMAYYERAVSRDSGFAVAWRRMNGVRGCGRKGFRGDPLAHEYGLRAGALNRGLAPRDSLLIAADSLSEALFDQLGDSVWQQHRVRLFTTLGAALQRYPSDPEVWYELGEALYHWPTPARTIPEQALQAFDRAIALDSAFGPAYVHPIELLFQLGRLDPARRYLKAYLALNQTDPNSEGMGLVDKLLGEATRRSPAVARQLGSASSYVLFSALWILRHAPDSEETAVRVGRALVQSLPTGEPVFDDSLVQKWGLGRALADRGHLREAHALLEDTAPQDFVHLALLGVVPADRVRVTFRQWYRTRDPAELSFDLLRGRMGALSWWSSTRDTAALQQAIRQWEGLKPGAGPARELVRWADYGAASSRAHLALARGDTADAVRRFAALPDTICSCVPDRIVTARLLSATGRADRAREMLERTWPVEWDPAGVMLLLERARVADRLGDRATTSRLYRFLADLWRNADPELRPYLEEARAKVPA